MSDDSKIAFALGGLAGNNAHGAGFLKAALDEQKEPAMISCTSGQIYWTYQYLLAKEKAKTNEKLDLRDVLEEKIDNMEPFHNENIDTFLLWLRGVHGVYRPAFQEWFQDLAINSGKSMERLMRSLGTTSFLEAFLEIFPNRLCVPLFTNEAKEIAEKLKNNREIGIIFNAYNPKEGTEYIYLNDKARELLRRSKKDEAKVKYVTNEQPSFRPESTYKDIDEDAVRNGLWLYEYGFDQKKDNYVDGAYFRQIMLSELTFATEIYVVRPISGTWLGDRLPTSYIQKEDLKTEVGFNGSYAGERHRIDLINQLIKDEALKSDKYHDILIKEVEIKVHRGYFDYIYESLDVFDKAYDASRVILQERLPAPELRQLKPAA